MDVFLAYRKPKAVVDHALRIDMKTSEFDFLLPEELIAQEPLADRAASRLMVLDRSARKILHTSFRHLVDYIQAGDVVVVNETKVAPVSLTGKRVRTGARIEALFLEQIGPSKWEVLLRPARRAKLGEEIVFDDIAARVVEDRGMGRKVLEIIGSVDMREVFYKIGRTPLPPYIKRRRMPEEELRKSYQTVYASKEGSAAAPTAGLHFTQEVLRQIEQKGAKIARVTLHIGIDTFRPIRSEELEEHTMHSEYFEISTQCAELVNAAKSSGHRILAVGTSTVRALESAVSLEGRLVPTKGRTNLFIKPGFDFRIVDRLLTNFHLPRSTLIVLVAAFAGKDFVLRAYEEAIRQKYRFFSFGDAMLIV